MYETRVVKYLYKLNDSLKAFCCFYHINSKIQENLNNENTAILSRLHVQNGVPGIIVPINTGHHNILQNQKMP